MPPKQAADLDKCPVNWLQDRHPSVGAIFPTRIPLPTGGLPPPFFASRVSLSKRQRQFLDDPLPAPVPARRPKSLDVSAVSAVDKTTTESQVGKLLHLQRKSPQLSGSLTLPTEQPPVICAQSRSHLRT